jgi:hypothetical protein
LEMEMGMEKALGEEELEMEEVVGYLHIRLL